MLWSQDEATELCALPINFENELRKNRRCDNYYLLINFERKGKRKKKLR